MSCRLRLWLPALAGFLALLAAPGAPLAAERVAAPDPTGDDAVLLLVRELSFHGIVPPYLWSIMFIFCLPFFAGASCPKPKP